MVLIRRVCLAAPLTRPMCRVDSATLIGRTKRPYVQPTMVRTVDQFEVSAGVVELVLVAVVDFLFHWCLKNEAV